MRIRTGNLRRRRALQRVARAPLRIELLPFPEPTVDKLGDYMARLTKEIVESMRLPAMFVSSGPRLDDSFERMFASGGTISTRFGEWPIVTVPGMRDDELIVGYPDKPESAVKITNIGKTKP